MKTRKPLGELSAVAQNPCRKVPKESIPPADKLHYVCFRAFSELIRVSSFQSSEAVPGQKSGPISPIAFVGDASTAASMVMPDLKPAFINKSPAFRANGKSSS